MDREIEQRLELLEFVMKQALLFLSRLGSDDAEFVRKQFTETIQQIKYHGFENDAKDRIRANSVLDGMT